MNIQIIILCIQYSIYTVTSIVNSIKLLSGTNILVYFIKTKESRITTTRVCGHVSKGVGVFDPLPSKAGEKVSISYNAAKPPVQKTLTFTQNVGNKQVFYAFHQTAGLQIRNDLFRIRIRIFFLLDSGSGSGSDQGF